MQAPRFSVLGAGTRGPTEHKASPRDSGTLHRFPVFPVLAGAGHAMAGSFPSIPLGLYWIGPSGNND